MEGSRDIESLRSKFYLEEIAREQATSMNFSNIIYEGIDTKNPKVILMDYFWYSRE